MTVYRMKDTPIVNSLEALREKRGLSAAALAALVGVSRQTIYAIEAGTYVPNTVTSLQLARALGVSVEDLFSLPATANETRVEAVTPLSAVPGQPVQLCRIDERLVATAPSAFPWFLPPSDAIMTSKTRARIADPSVDFSNRLLIAGCDPAISVLARHMQSSGVTLILAHRNSTQALALLKSGSGFMLRASHLQAEYISEGFARCFLTPVWEEGIVTANGNPKGVRGVEDFSRKDIKIVNREAGAGSRILLDAQLKRLTISPDQADRIPDHRVGTSGNGVRRCALARPIAASRHVRRHGRFGLDFITAADGSARRFRPPAETSGSACSSDAFEYADSRRLST